MERSGKALSSLTIKSVGRERGHWQSPRYHPGRDMRLSGEGGDTALVPSGNNECQSNG